MNIPVIQTKDGKDIISSLFFKFLPIQVMIVAMSSINSIVDGVIAGQFIDATTVGVVGLYYSMVNLLGAIGAVLLGGTSVLCGRYMGAADKEKTKNIFSLNITVTLIIGVALTLISVFLSGPMAVVLGATPELKAPLVLYIRGYAIGIIPLLLGQQIASFLQLEQQSKRTYVAIGALITSNVLFDIFFVAILKWGILGLAIATSASNLVYFLILAQYYLTDKAQLKYSRHNIAWDVLPDVIKIGIPGAMLVFCLSMRGLVVNRILITYAGNDGLSAMSAFNMISGLLISYCLGAGAVVRMLASIFIGEKNVAAIKHLFKIVFTKGLALTVALAVIVILLSGQISGIFFPDKGSNVFNMAKELIIIYGLCIPMILFCVVSSNYMQAMQKNVFVNILSVFDGFFSMVIPSLVLAPILGARGVWLANPIGIFLTALLTPIYCIFTMKRVPKNLGEWLLLSDGFGIRNDQCLNYTINNMDDVAQTSERVHRFCEDNGISQKLSYYSALCLEEMAANVVDHGFAEDNKKHSVDIHVICEGKDVQLRIKDDCVPFNPEELYEMVSSDEEDPLKNVGIRIVHELADEVIYQNMIGLNVLTIKLRDSH
ncbi:MAG: ATP-binding protein [Firmicutes bacterium]|nr:ATP-binding protein [Bacillota bacterium]